MFARPMDTQVLEGAVLKPAIFFNQTTLFMNEYFVGQVILHNGRYKTVRSIGRNWIETIYLKPNDKGWKKVEIISTSGIRPYQVRVDRFSQLKKLWAAKDLKSYKENKKALVESLLASFNH